MNAAVVTKLHGYSDDPAVAKEVMLELDSGGEWIFVEVIDSCIQVWSAKACQDCKLTTKGLQRCQLHLRVSIVALQLRLADPARPNWGSSELAGPDAVG